MLRKVFIVRKCILAVLLLCTTTTNAAPTKATPKDYPPPPSSASQASKHALEDIQLIQPHIITIEHFEELLRRAGEIFRPAAFQLAKENAAAPTAATQHQATAAVAAVAAVPYQQMQPPAAQPYNFYLPLYDYDENPKLDAKSRQLGQITPPPAPNAKDAQTDYYAAAGSAVKPRKLPKKFSAVAKQVNIKWLNAFEKEMFGNGAVAGAATDAASTAGDNGELLPTKTAVYLVNDERNRIKFDDSFFGVDMSKVRAPADAHRVQATAAAAATQASAENATDARRTNGFLNEGEEMHDGGEELDQDEDEEAEDLLAAPQVPQVNYVTVKTEIV